MPHFSPLPAPARPLSVLVIDDDDVDRERLVRRLHRYRHPLLVQEAGSKSEALAALRTKTYDFIFLDFNLTDGDGRDLLPEINEAGTQRSLIVAVTGAGNEQVAASAIKSGIHEYLPKYALSAQRLYQALDDGQRYLAVQKKLRAAEQQLHRRSLYDSLTELPNRNLFFDRLEQCCLAFSRQQIPFAVMMIDLDRFKEVNDKLGHLVGDAVLHEVGKRFFGLLRATDTIARLGGDEFAVLLPDVDSAGVAELVGQKIVDALHQPVFAQGHALSLGASVGIALCPEHAQTPTALVSYADNAMYQAKRGINKIILHGEGDEMAQSSLPAQALLAELEEAIRLDELVMHYQPKIRLDTREVVGFESLVRWQHRRRGLLGPGHFVPTLESSPLLAAFTDKTMDLALAQSALWRSRGHVIKLALNISARMLDDDDFVPRFLRLLAHHGVPAQTVSLELTETALLVSPAKAKAMVKTLRANGVDLSIDDFGAGFTSFTYLRDFSPHEIKLDCAFVSDLTAEGFNASLVRSLSMLCSALGADFIAEGVERLETWKILLDLGCRLGQGYSIARPMAGEDVLSWLAHWKTAPLAMAV